MKRFAAIIILIMSINILSASSADTLSSSTIFEGRRKSPFVATTFSMVFPAGGQLYNGKLLKAGVFMTAELALGGIAAYNFYLNSQGETYDMFGYGTALGSAKMYSWFFAAVYVYSIMDAYVDAHLSAFPSEKLILEPDPGVNGIRLSYQF